MRARERALKSFLKWMVSLPWHGRGPLLPPLPYRGRNRWKSKWAETTWHFLHFSIHARRRDGNPVSGPLWIAAGGMEGRFSSLPFSFTPSVPLFVTDPKKFLDPYFTQSSSFPQSLSLFNWDRGRKLGRPYPSKRVLETRGIKKFRCTFDQGIRCATDCKSV